MSKDSSETYKHDNQSQESIEEFDANRAMLRDKDLFSSFHVKTTYPLREALDRGEVNEGTPILVMHRKAGTLTFLKHQIVSHHIAYGEMAGQQWMIVL